VPHVYDVDFDLGYISRNHIFVYTGTTYSDDNVPRTWINDTQILCNVALDEEFTLRRVVPRDEPVNDYVDGAILRDKNLDDSFAQSLMILEEIADGYFAPDGTLIIDNDLDMHLHNIVNCLSISGLRNATLATEATPFLQVQQLIAAKAFAGTHVTPYLTPRHFGDGTTTVFATLATEFTLAESFQIQLDGVQQRPYTDYTVTIAGEVDFVEAPPTLTAVDITWFQPLMLETGVGVGFVTSTGTGDGVSTDFMRPVTASPNIDDHIISFDGILQEPVVDFITTGNIIRFINAPASMVRVVIRSVIV